MNVIQQGRLGALALVGFVKLVRDIAFDDRQRSRGQEIREVLQSSETAAALMREFAEDPAHRETIARRPRIGALDLEALGRLPAGTLGRAFADEMRSKAYDPNAYSRDDDDGTVAGYVFLHIKETHDLWHTATGFDVDVAGELGLQAFVFSQCYVTLAPVIVAAGILNTFFYNMNERRSRMDAIARGWQLGRSAKPLFGFDWHAHWTTPLAEVRANLGLRVSDAGAPD